MITLRELAKLAGVSVSTASKALSGASDIGPETRGRVAALAEERGYDKSRRKSKGTRFTGPNIAVIYSDITSHYYSKILALFDDKISELGGLVVAACSRFQMDRVAELCKYFEEGRAMDGIVCISPFHILGQIPKLKIPLVGISYPSFEPHPFDYICVNDGVGIDEAVEQFALLGHTRIAYIGEAMTAHRQRFFRESMARHNCTVFEELIRNSNVRFERAGYEVMKRMLMENEIPTAVLAAYDDIALGAVRAIHEAGLRIPEDISIAGVDNTMAMIDDEKVLASVNCHIEEQVEIALGLLMKKIEEPSFTAVQNVSLRTELQRGNTIAKAETR